MTQHPSSEAAGGGTSSGGPSSTGLDPKLAGLLCYLLWFFGAVAMLILEKRDRSVRFHAFQSLGTFGAIFVLSVVLPFVPIVGRIASFLLSLAAVVLWLVLMGKAYQGEQWKLPWVGDWAEEQAG